MKRRNHSSFGNRKRATWKEIRSRIAVRSLVSLGLMLLLFTTSLPPVVAASFTSEAASRSWTLVRKVGDRTSDWLRRIKEKRDRKNGKPQDPLTSRGTKPQRPQTKSQREGKVAGLRINPKGDVTLHAGQSKVLSAVPLDIEGQPVQGLSGEWESSDSEVVSIDKTGRAVAGKPGKATLTAKAGSLSQTIRVTVTKANKEEGGKKKTSTRRKTGAIQDLTPRNQTSARADESRHHARRVTPRPLVPLRPIDEDPLPDDESGSLYTGGNAVGSPPGRTLPGSSTPPAATGGTETGNANFTFALPVVGMAGRGLGISLSLVYNSRLWNKSTDGTYTYMTYDVDSGWPSQGFRLSFGQIEDQGSYGFTLTEPDGTRRALANTSGSNYETVDGSFIHFVFTGSGEGTLYYPDGTIVAYGASGGGYRSYPERITDRNGNYVDISYAGTDGAGPQIETITDTLERHVSFYYASNGDLVTITAPGLSGDLQVMRFYYEDVTIPSSGLFASPIYVSAPGTVHALKSVYLPMSSDGGSPIYTAYQFDYSEYGMIYQTSQLRGVTASTTSPTTAGTLSTGSSSVAAQTTYDYNTTAASLSDVPSYSTRTDEWAGRTTVGSAPAFTFTQNESTGVSTVTAPDGTVTRTQTIVNSGQWDHGLVSDTYTQYGSTPTVLFHTHLDWERDSGNQNPRVYQARTTDVPASLTKATVLSYTSYNNVSVVSERDFSTDGSVSSTELRKTITTYETSSGYLNRFLLHLPDTVKVCPGASETAVSLVDYAYDNYGSSHAYMTGRTGIIMHDDAFDPFGGSYVSATDYRGNVTSVTTYANAAGETGAVTHSTKYDIAGNVTTADVDCCQSRSYTYSSTNDDYAYPISVTSGDPGGLHTTTQAEFDYDTGLQDTATDENSRVTEYRYYSSSLRLHEIDYPDDGLTSYSYSDGVGTNANVVSTVKLDSSRDVSTYRYLDGRGSVVRTFGNLTSAYVTQDIRYDAMGRAYQASNPYYSTGPGSTINPDDFWTTKTFDRLGRVIEVTMPRGDNNSALTTNVSTVYAGVYTTVTDQSGKLRRQKVDALGRVIRLDEPTTSGLGDESSPNQATTYYYDLLNNLVQIAQGSQNRYFKYDSLSRLIREKQVEQETNSSYNLSDAWNTAGTWTRKIEYNSSGLVTNAYDARGVQTSFSYDALNRLTGIDYYDSTPDAHYYYDGNLPSGAPSYTPQNAGGRVTAMTYGSGTPITGNYFSYDTMGRVTAQKQVTGSSVYSLSYAYNHAGLLTGETYPSSRALTYAYDNGGRLSSVSDGTTTFASSLNYEAHGGLTTETFGNTAVHTLTYNRRMQASQVKLSLSSSVLQQYDYGYGEFSTSTGNVDTSKNNGQIGKITGTIGTTVQWNQGFSYDELGRLANFREYQSSVSSPTYTHGYTYDRYGNRFQSANSTLGLLEISSSEIVSTTNRFIAGGSTPTTYDASGNITVDTKFRGLKYEYDANGRQSAVKLLDNSGLQTSVYDGAGQRVRTVAGSVTRTMVYDIFGQQVADYLGEGGAILERENIYRGGQLLATDDSPAVAAPSALSGSLSGSNIGLSWTAVSGASYYRVEKKVAGGSFTLKDTPSTNSLTDSDVSSSTAYLYRVCTADSSGACLSAYSNVALGATTTFSTDPTIYTEAENPGYGTTVKAAHIDQLRAAVNAVRTLAGSSTISTPDPAPDDLIYATDVTTLRTKLGEALSALGIYNPTYTDPLLPSGTLIKKAHITELRAKCIAGSSCYKSISAFVTGAYQGVLNRAPSSGELSSATATLTQAQSLGQSYLISAAQSLLSTLFNSSEYSALGTTNAQFVTDLYEGYLQRAPDDSGYNYYLTRLNNSTDTRAQQMAAVSAPGEFQTNVVSLCVAFGGGGGLRYVLSDLQGSARVAMNNNGSSSAVVARHDYLPFGEEIGSGVGSRSSSQGYAASDPNRWKYAMTERDATSGLDHTWWRKYESLSGRWTSPDPFLGSAFIVDPQTFNRYSYVQNDPINKIDPSGLRCEWVLHRYGVDDMVNPISWEYHWELECVADPEPFRIIRESGGQGLFGGPFVQPPGPRNPPVQKKDSIKVDPKQEAWNRAKKNCLERKAKERKTHMEQLASRVAKAALVGCIFTGAGSAFMGFVGGGLVGAVTGPGAPLVGAAGATVGGILGCSVGVLVGSFGQLTLGEYWERNENREKEASADAECNDEANLAVSGK